jgi:hypothetical protein
LKTYLLYVLFASVVAYLASYRQWSSLRGRIEVTIIALVCVCVMVGITDATPLNDFLKGYYPGGRTLWEDTGRLYDCPRGSLCFVNVPIVGALFSPFSFMPERLAGAVFTVAGIAVAIFALWRLARGARDEGGRAVLAMAALNGPLAHSIRLGNISHILLLPVASAFAAQSKGRQVHAGLLLALVALLKPLFVLFLPYFLLRRQWLAFVAMAGGGALAVLLSMLMFGIEIHRVFVNDFILGFGAKPVIAYNVQNYGGFLGHLTMPGNFKNWGPFDEPLWFKMARLALGGVTMALCALAMWRAGNPKTPAAWLAELSIMLCIALLIAPVTWTHYLCLLLIPLAFAATGQFRAPPNGARDALYVAAAILVSLPVIMPHRRDFLPFFTHRIWVSHFMAGTVLLLAALTWTRLAMRANRKGLVDAAGPATSGSDFPSAALV